MKKSDSQLQHDVMAELEWEPAVDHADIGVAVTDGVVTLSGYVKNFTEKLAAEKAVRRVAGVRAIAEEINVRLASDSKMADHEIAKRIVDIIAWTISIPVDTVKVKVEHGWVTLSGTLHPPARAWKNIVSDRPFWRGGDGISITCDSTNDGSRVSSPWLYRMRPRSRLRPSGPPV